MTRLTEDAIMLQAYIGAGETLKLDTIALELFPRIGSDGTPGIGLISRHRATMAMRILANFTGFTVKPSRTNPQIITAHAKNTGLQSQAIMGMMCRSGIDRRKEDRDVEEDRRERERRTD